MGLQRAAVLYPVNSTTVDTGSGIDVRLLDSAEAGADDSTQTAQFTHTNDNVERTFDPATGAVTNTNNANTTLFKTGWGLRLFNDMTPLGVLDVSGNARHGTITGKPAVIASPWTDFGSAFDFSGTDNDNDSDGVQGPLFPPTGLTAMTTEFKVRRDRQNAVEVIGGWFNPSSGTLNRIDVFFYSDNKLYMQVWNAGSLLVSSGTSGTVANGNHTVAVGWSGSNIYLYLDGVMSASAPLASLPTDSQMRFWVGRQDWVSTDGSAPYALDGAVDEVRVSNSDRYGGVNYTPSSAPFANDANTLLLWHMDALACQAYLPAGTLTVGLRVNATQSGGTYASGTFGPTFRAALWRYDPIANTGTLIAAGTTTGTTWNVAGVGGDLGTAKNASISINVSSAVTFAVGEILLLQVGLNTGTVPDPSVGTATFTVTLTVDNTNTKITWASGQNIAQACALSSSPVGVGISSRSANQIELSRSPLGVGVPTSSKATVAAKTFSLVGVGLITRTLALALARSAVGIGVPSSSKATVAAKSFTVTGAGIVTRTLILTLSRSATGVGVTSSSKATVAAKTFSLVGVGVATRTLALELSRDALGVGVPSSSKVTLAAKSFDVIGVGSVTRGALVLDLARSPVGVGVASSSKATVAAKEFSLTGVGTITEAHPVQAYRTFNLTGVGVISGRIELPLDRIPTEGGITVIRRKKVIVYDKV